MNNKKLLCKKSYGNTNGYGQPFHIESGSCYDCDFLESSLTTITVTGENDVIYYFVLGDDTIEHEWYLYKFFYTEKELRKIKLEKLNNL